MTIPYTFVALLDVLGYKNKIDADRSAGSEDFKQKLESSLSVLLGINETEVSYQAISDTLIISIHPNGEFSELLRILKRVHLGFLSNGLLLRGGIAFAPHFRSGTITYSHALPIAYQLEQRQAVYPRVVIDRNIIEMFAEGGKLTAERACVSAEELICEQNGVYFVNVAGGCVTDYYDCARSVYEQEKAGLAGKEHELAKHRWLQDYIVSLRPDVLTQYIDPLAVYRPG